MDKHFVSFIKIPVSGIWLMNIYIIDNEKDGDG
jgi:hypothetical protein